MCVCVCVCVCYLTFLTHFLVSLQSLSYCFNRHNFLLREQSRYPTLEILYLFIFLLMRKAAANIVSRTFSFLQVFPGIRSCKPDPWGERGCGPRYQQARHFLKGLFLPLGPPVAVSVFPPTPRGSWRPTHGLAGGSALSLSALPSSPSSYSLFPLAAPEAWATW